MSNITTIINSSCLWYRLRYGISNRTIIKIHITKMLNETYEYLDEQIEEYFKFLSPEEATIVSQDGVVAILIMCMIG